jgi:hypothetical protein
VLWQQFKPNGATTSDVFVGARYQLTAIEQAYVQAHETAAGGTPTSSSASASLDAQVARADAPLTPMLSHAWANDLVNDATNGTHIGHPQQAQRLSGDFCGARCGRLPDSLRRAPCHPHASKRRSHGSNAGNKTWWMQAPTDEHSLD